MFLQIASFLLLLKFARGLYENADVVHLNVDNFDRLVTHGTDTWVVQFYSPYCPYCQEFAPSFEKAANILRSSDIKVGVVDANEDKTLLRRYEIKGIPNVKIYHPNNPNPETYSGPRTTEALVSQITALKKGKRFKWDEDEMPIGTEPMTKVEYK